MDPQPQAAPPASEHVIAAMSGGVDSSVTAKLLQDAGYQVLGVTLKLFGDDVAASGGDTQACCSLDDVEDARAVARQLGMPHYVFNFADDFGTFVIDRFCESYLQGRTPNPCIDCNRYIKFAALHRRRAELDCDYLATGHYARRCWDEQRGRFLLKTGLDADKDQSYVLYNLTQEQLAHTLFPLGELTKAQVRDVAAAAGFANAQKAESQDICFVPDGNYQRFIEARTGRTLQPGPIVDLQGNVLGTHAGLDRYTVGQRKGIGIAAAQPLYVCRKDLETNQLVVGTAEEATCTRVLVEDVNWISVAQLNAPLRVTAKTFYRQKAAPALLTQTGPTNATLLFDQPIRACAPGQAAVFYQEDVVVGGGVISSCDSPRL
ncbi:MAG: tRNA 2-thiouridine(34) synthase MnmA [Coriobacteriia bacterium]|nr:tRNA 2-thiouridine(34) synthase MnmA [Coriobacteriia bacterium]